jgi:hypothetical protein
MLRPLESMRPYGGTILALNPHWSTWDMASDGKEKEKGEPVNTGTNMNEIKKLLEKEEPRLDMLQWYLKMILENEEDPKPKK